MSVLIVLAGILFLIFLFASWLGRTSPDEKPITYICMRCERLYATPDVPIKCRSCEGNVAKF